MPKFSLICEPWIRCSDLNGQVRAVGLAECLASSQDFSEIVDESPLVVAALHRLLLAVLHRNFGPRDTEAWGDLWKRHHFHALDAYWTKWESRFNLFDDVHPFYQSATITEGDGPGTIAKLQFHRSAGNNATLVDHTTDDRPPAMQAAEAARALVTHQTFALGGTVGYLESCEKDSDKRGSDSPSARGAFCLLQGANLFETLMLNLAEYDQASHPNDLPCWEREPSQGRGERTPTGRVDLFTWQGRRSRLFRALASDGSTWVDRAKLVPGFHVPLLWSPFKDESLQSFVLQSEAKPDERPWFQYRITPERAVWRDSSAIIHGIEGEKRSKRQPLTFSWIAQLVWHGELPAGFHCRIGVAGFATHQQKVKLWRREELSVTAGLLQDPRCQESLRSALQHADDTAYALSAATEKLAAEILSPSLDANALSKPDPTRVKQLAASLGTEMRYWSCLSIPFQAFLESLGASQQLSGEENQHSAQDVAFNSWKRSVRNAALDAFTQASSGVTQNVRGLRAQAIAETDLKRRLVGVTRRLLGADADGKK